jgi:feruloyl-CoA synthase
VILPPDTIVTVDVDGVLRLQSPYRLGPYPASITERLDRWAALAGGRTFLAARGRSGDWDRLSYAAVHARVRAVAQALIDRRLSAERPVLILSGNSLEHAVLALAAMYVGIPYAPISPSYCLLSRDFGTLGAIAGTLTPGLILAVEGPRFEAALQTLRESDAEVVTVTAAPGLARQTAFRELLAVAPTSEVDAAHRALAPSTVAKILFTSGSTGAPKGVVTTHGMLAVNQEQLRTAVPCVIDPPPVLCDWLPWNHTFGGSHNFGLALYNGGTLYVDAGAPTPAGFDTTLANLREVATTAYFNVPRGYELLLPALEADRSLRELFFSRVQMLFYAAAGLRQQVSDGIEALAIETRGVPIPWVSGLGATETAPFAIFTGPMPSPVAGRIGVPVPGVEMKVVPSGPAREARVRGPNVTPGYWKDPDRTAAAFDAEGFYCMGDAVALVDAGDPSRGFDFAGRLTEDFKLSTGTWVRVGPLRTSLLAHLGALAQDVVIAGHDRDAIGVLVFPAMAACRRLAGADDAATARQVLGTPVVVERLLAALADFSDGHAGSSTRVACAVLVEEPPSIDANEITDKGTVNQRAVLRNRPALVDRLFGAPGDAIRVVVPQRSAQP